ncbi:hypothetical protein D3C85_1356590 [compost metagenome]
MFHGFAFTELFYFSYAICVLVARDISWLEFDRCLSVDLIRVRKSTIFIVVRLNELRGLSDFRVEIFRLEDGVCDCKEIW